MGRSQPYRCPAPGCGKSGKLSGVKQHYRDKHDPNVIDLDLESMILRGIAIEGAATPQNPLIAELHWSLGFRRGMLFGMLLGALVAFALSYGVLAACNQGVEICPSSIIRLIRGS